MTAEQYPRPEIKKGDETMSDPKPIYYDDPRRVYFKLQHTLAIAVPESATKVLDDFAKDFKKAEIPKATRELMLEAIEKAIIHLKGIEDRLLQLKKLLLEVDGE
jgi:hypothetical protein